MFCKKAIVPDLRGKKPTVCGGKITEVVTEVGQRVEVDTFCDRCGQISNLSPLVIEKPKSSLLGRLPVRLH